jgi:hypothetical protein
VNEGALLPDVVAETAVYGTALVSQNERRRFSSSN